MSDLVVSQAREVMPCAKEISAEDSTPTLGCVLKVANASSIRVYTPRVMPRYGLHAWAE